ncbi:MAG: hypothetical protein ACHP79_02875 [Terriglobales bacterium]
MLPQIKAAESPIKKRLCQKQGRLSVKKLPGSYFGGGVVVPPLLFLPFLPPLWPFLVLVAFLPLVVEAAVAFLPGSVLAPLLPVVPWAIARVAPSNMVNTNVNSFFMLSPLKGSSDM